MKHCPFCGGDASSDSGGFGKYFISCDTCFAKGEMCVTESEAIFKWNARHHKKGRAYDLIVSLTYRGQQVIVGKHKSIIDQALIAGGTIRRELSGDYTLTLMALHRSL